MPPQLDNLLAVIKTGRPLNEAWRKDLDTDQGVFRFPKIGGSVNIPASAHAVQAFIEPDKAAEYWQTRTLAQLGEIEVPERFFRALDTHEIGSRTYLGISHVSEAAAAAALLDRVPKVAAILERSLRQRMAFLRLMQVSDVIKRNPAKPDRVVYQGPVAPLAGMRGTHRLQNAFDPILNRVMNGTGVSKWEDRTQDIYDGVAPRLHYADGLAGMKPAELVAELGACRVIVPYHILAWDDLMVTWVDNNVNGNTGCMFFCAYGAMIEKPGSGPNLLDYEYKAGAPPVWAWGWPYKDDYQRIRHAHQGLGTGWCRLEGNLLTAANLTQEEAGARAVFTRKLTLPQHPPRYRVDLWTDRNPLLTLGGAVPDPGPGPDPQPDGPPVDPNKPDEPVQPEEPVEPEPVEPPELDPRRQKIAEGLLELGISQGQLALRAKLVEELRKPGPLGRTGAAISADIFTLGVPKKQMPLRRQLGEEAAKL